jgi:L-asparaginase II
LPCRTNSRSAAVERIGEAIAVNLSMIAGSGRLSTGIIALTGRRVLVKFGADGVYTAALKEQGL